MSLGGPIAGISGEDACALLFGKWAAEQLGSTWLGLAAVGDVSVHFHSGCCAVLGMHTGYLCPGDLHEDVWEI